MHKPAGVGNPLDVQNMPDVHTHGLLSAQLGCGSLLKTLGQRSADRQEAKNRPFLKFFSFLHFSFSHQFSSKVVINSQAAALAVGYGANHPTQHMKRSQTYEKEI
jgi:hypothetical protein